MSEEKKKKDKDTDSGSNSKSETVKPYGTVPGPGSEFKKTPGKEEYTAYGANFGTRDKPADSKLDEVVDSVMKKQDGAEDKKGAGLSKGDKIRSIIPFASMMSRNVPNVPDPGSKSETLEEKRSRIQTEVDAGTYVPPQKKAFGADAATKSVDLLMKAGQRFLPDIPSPVASAAAKPVTPPAPAAAPAPVATPAPVAAPASKSPVAGEMDTLLSQVRAAGAAPTVTGPQGQAATTTEPAASFGLSFGEKYAAREAADKARVRETEAHDLRLKAGAEGINASRAARNQADRMDYEIDRIKQDPNSYDRSGRIRPEIAGMVAELRKTQAGLYSGGAQSAASLAGAGFGADQQVTSNEISAEAHKVSAELNSMASGFGHRIQAAGYNMTDKRERDKLAFDILKFKSENDTKNPQVVAKLLSTVSPKKKIKTRDVDIAGNMIGEQEVEVPDYEAGIQILKAAGIDVPEGLVPKVSTKAAPVAPKPGDEKKASTGRVAVYDGANWNWKK